jgi:hypothetical protein
METKRKLCRSKCEECPFVSCNFNPSFIDISLLVGKKRQEDIYSSPFAWVKVEKAYEASE